MFAASFFYPIHYFELQLLLHCAASLRRLLNSPEATDTTEKKIKLRLSDYINARFVTVAGSLNSWNNAIQPLHWLNGAWETTIQVAPGTYRYKLVVDGVWLSDPKNPNMNKDSFDSILEVNK